MDSQHDLHRSPLINHNTVASSPGRLRSNPLRFARYYPVPVIRFLLFVCAQVTLLCYISQTVSVPTSIVIATGLDLYVIWLYWKHVRAMGFHGDLCACKVTSIDPLRVAVHTDIGHSGPIYNVIKVIQPPIRSLNGRPFQVGDTFASVALYKASAEHDDRWADFTPRPVQCFTSDSQQIADAVERIPQQIWDELDRGIHQIRDRAVKTGLHPFS